jgi:hypothetical protein
MEEVYRITKSEPTYLKSVIRGYVLEAERGIDTLLKELGKPGFKFNKDKEVAFKQIGDVRSELDKWLLDTIFDTKKYSEAPPDFEPLPDVRIKDLSDEEKLKNLYMDRLNKLTKKELEVIYDIYGLKDASLFKKKKEDISDKIIRMLLNGRWGKYGATGLKDIDVIIEKELHKKKGDYKPNLARSGYFKVVMSGSGVRSGGKASKINRAFRKAFDPKKNGVAKAFDKAGSDMASGMNTMVEGLNKINPMMIALNNDKSRKLMAQSGELTNDYLLPAVVSAGKPLYDTSAMAASTMLTGNPVLGNSGG